MLADLCRTIAGQSIISQQFICHICNAHLSSKGALVTHIKGSHLASGLYACEQCGESFKWNMQLVRHRRRYHGDGVVFEECSENLFDAENVCWSHICICIYIYINNWRIGVIFSQMCYSCSLSWLSWLLSSLSTACMPGSLYLQYYSTVEHTRNRCVCIATSLLISQQHCIVPAINYENFSCLAFVHHDFYAELPERTFCIIYLWKTNVKSTLRFLVFPRLMIS